MTGEYDAVVYDLDNTLVHLPVDWEQVERDVADTLREQGVEVPDADDVWPLFDRAEATGHADALEAVVAEFERAGAREAELLPTADGLPHDVPVGVCSLNCEAACHIALERHGLDRYVETVVGRDSGPWKKPDPEPLLAALEALGVPPANAVFVGDSDSDEVCATNAGVAFCYVEDWC
ncbi:HAD family hydrolase [Halorarius litoreus]|uniref:HAD family hydrolase n=1 Tax=Halorarius litoreus TaxID=2962676 RepID=UPI0020CD055F|nr:HAD family hydrolase [Halorarius litoreus]